MRRRWLGPLLAATGALAIGALVADAGLPTVVAAIARAAPLLPAIAACELALALADLVALRALHGPGIPARTWLRGAALAYASGAFLPAGRVAGELARASELAPYVGAPRAVAAATVVHGTFLWASAAISVPCWAAVALASSPTSTLAWLLAANGVFHAGLGSLLVLGPRAGARVALRAGERAAEVARAIRALPALPSAPITVALVARLVQLAQCALLVGVAGGSADLGGALIADGIQLVAASVGDAIPGQAGVAEAAYRTFAPELGLSSSVAHALAIALTLRVCRVVLGALAALLSLGGRTPLAFAPRHGRAGALAALLCVLALAPSAASAQSSVVHQRLGAVIEPTGAEHMIAIGMRAPLGPAGDPLFEGAHVEAAIVDYVSPIDTRNGVYLEVAPLAFLVLRAELVGIRMWSTGMDGAGFFAVDGDLADVRAQSLPGSRGGEASGWNLRLGAILQGAVRLGALRPILWSQLTMEHEVLGDARYHYSPRADVVLRRDDWMLVSSTLALVEVDLVPGIALRAGAFDEVRWVPRSDALSNQVGPALALAIDRPDRAVEEILFLVRAGTYTDHATREGAWSGLAALIVRYAP